MRKSEFVAKVAAAAGVTQRETEKVIDAMCPIIVETCVKDGDEISLPIGKFKQKVNPAREGVNPLTGKKMQVKESKSLAFKASKTVKEKEEKAKKSSKKK